MCAQDPFRFGDVMARAMEDAVEMAVYVRPVLTEEQQTTLASLRRAWRRERRVQLTLKGGMLTGKVTQVAVTGAFVVVAGVHVPIDEILSHKVAKETGLASH